MGKIKGDIIVLQTLDDIPVQAGRKRHNFDTGQHFGALKRHPPGHNQPDIPGTQDYDPPSGHPAFQVHKTLGSARGIESGASRTGCAQRTARAFTAPHSQNNRAGFDCPDTQTR